MMPDAVGVAHEVPATPGFGMPLATTVKSVAWRDGAVPWVKQKKETRDMASSQHDDDDDDLHHHHHNQQQQGRRRPRRLATTAMTKCNHHHPA